MSTAIVQFATPTVQLNEIYPTFESWRERGQWLTEATSLTQWDIADWLLAGERLYGKKSYEEAAEITGYSIPTLRNICSVATKVSRQRDTSLSFRHHAEVAKLSPAKQVEWLQRAKVGQLSAHTLREEIKAQESPAPVTDNSQKLTREDLRALDSVAKSRGIKRAALIVSIVRNYLLNRTTLPEVEAWVADEAYKRHEEAKIIAANKLKMKNQLRLRLEREQRAEDAWILPERALENQKLLDLYPNRKRLKGGLVALWGESGHQFIRDLLEEMKAETESSCKEAPVKPGSLKGSPCDSRSDV